MSKMFIDYDYGVPRIVCTDCGICNSVMGKSLCGKINRGCCHYFPDFNLAEIHRLLMLPGGQSALETILNNCGTVVNNFNILVKGTFDNEGYEVYIKNGCSEEYPTINDHTIFFRSCPFVKPGVGCSLPCRFRTTVCNFFVCSEILDIPALRLEINPYIKERDRYSRWIHRESIELQHVLNINNTNLIINFERSIEILKDLPLNNYEFPELVPVEY